MEDIDIISYLKSLGIGGNDETKKRLYRDYYIEEFKQEVKLEQKARKMGNIVDMSYLDVIILFLIIKMNIN